MRGRDFSSDQALPERDLYDLSDALALRLYQRLGRRCYALSRHDVAELIAPYIGDLVPDDRRALSWLVWDLLQEGADLELAPA